MDQKALCNYITKLTWEICKFSGDYRWLGEVRALLMDNTYYSGQLIDAEDEVMKALCNRLTNVLKAHKLHFGKAHRSYGIEANQLIQFGLANDKKRLSEYVNKAVKNCPSLV